MLDVRVDDAALWIDATGTRRRLQALFVLGWPRSLIAAVLDLPERGVVKLTEANTVQRPIADRVSQTYDRLWMRLPGAPASLADIARTRMWAARQGWVSALGWDDDDIDDPSAMPNTAGDPAAPAGIDDVAVARRLAGERDIQLTTAEAAELVRRGLRQRLSPSQIERQSGIKASRHVTVQTRVAA